MISFRGMDHVGPKAPGLKPPGETSKRNPAPESLRHHPKQRPEGSECDTSRYSDHQHCIKTLCRVLFVAKGLGLPGQCFGYPLPFSVMILQCIHTKVAHRRWNGHFSCAIRQKTTGAYTSTSRQLERRVSLEKRGVVWRKEHNWKLWAFQ